MKKKVIVEMQHGMVTSVYSTLKDLEVLVLDTTSNGDGDEICDKSEIDKFTSNNIWYNISTTGGIYNEDYDFNLGNPNTIDNSSIRPLEQIIDIVNEYDASILNVNLDYPNNVTKALIQDYNDNPVLFEYNNEKKIWE